MHLRKQLIVASLVTFFTSSVLAQESDNFIDNTKVVPLTRFLEAEPLNKKRAAHTLVASEMGREEYRRCGCCLPFHVQELAGQKTPFRSELLAQFIIGSAAYQIENPTEKGKLVPQQIAGMRSLLKAYHSYQAKNLKVSIPELDIFSAQESKGTLAEFMKPLIASECKS